MPSTFTQLLYHVVFSTKHRTPWLTDSVTDRLYPYIGGIVRNENGVLLSCGGVEDHNHLFLRYRTDKTIADLMRQVKSRASQWIHKEFPTLSMFGWQDGYAAFTVSQSGANDLKRYISNQKEHHQKRDFKEELLTMLRLNEIEFNERYVFD